MQVQIPALHMIKLVPLRDQHAPAFLSSAPAPSPTPSNLALGSRGDAQGKDIIQTPMHCMAPKNDKGACARVMQIHARHDRPAVPGTRLGKRAPMSLWLMPSPRLQVCLAVQGVHTHTLRLCKEGALSRRSLPVYLLSPSRFFTARPRVPHVCLPAQQAHTHMRARNEREHRHTKQPRTWTSERKQEPCPPNTTMRRPTTLHEC